MERFKTAQRQSQPVTVTQPELEFTKMAKRHLANSLMDVFWLLVEESYPPSSVALSILNILDERWESQSEYCAHEKEKSQRPPVTEMECEKKHNIHNICVHLVHPKYNLLALKKIRLFQNG